MNLRIGFVEYELTMLQEGRYDCRVKTALLWGLHLALVIVQIRIENIRVTASQLGQLLYPYLVVLENDIKLLVV